MNMSVFIGVNSVKNLLCLSYKKISNIFSSNVSMRCRVLIISGGITSHVA